MLLKCSGGGDAEVWWRRYPIEFSAGHGKLEKRGILALGQVTFFQQHQPHLTPFITARLWPTRESLFAEQISFDNLWAPYLNN